MVRKQKTKAGGAGGAGVIDKTKHHKGQCCREVKAKKQQRHLGLHVGVVPALQQQGGALGVVLAGRDVQRWQANFALGVILKQQGHNLLVTLLQRHRQGGKAILQEHPRASMAGRRLG